MSDTADIFFAAYLRKMASGDDYLFKKYGVPPTPVRVFPQLSVNEAHIKTALIGLLQLVDEHVTYWERTRSFKRIAMIQDARGLILNMLSALQKDQDRLPAVISAIWNKTLSSLIFAFRMPRANPAIPAVAVMRGRIAQDRQTFRAGMIDISNRLLEILRAEVQQHQLNGLPVEAIGEFLGNQRVLLENVQIEERLEDDEGVREGDVMDLVKSEPSQ